MPRGDEPRAGEKLSGTSWSLCTPAAPVETSSWCCDSTVLNGTAGTPAREVNGVPCGAETVTVAVPTKQYNV